MKKKLETHLRVASDNSICRPGRVWLVAVRERKVFVGMKRTPGVELASTIRRVTCQTCLMLWDRWLAFINQNPPSPTRRQAAGIVQLFDREKLAARLAEENTAAAARRSAALHQLTKGA